MQEFDLSYPHIMQQIPLAMKVAPDRLVLHAFVCGNGCVEQRHYEGSIDILMLVQLCPKHCRYAVVEWYGQFHVLDVKGEEDQTVKAASEHPDLDTAIMAAQLTY